SSCCLKLFSCRDTPVQRPLTRNRHLESGEVRLQRPRGAEPEVVPIGEPPGWRLWIYIPQAIRSRWRRGPVGPFRNGDTPDQRARGAFYALLAVRAMSQKRDGTRWTKSSGCRSGKVPNPGGSG